MLFFFCILILISLGWIGCFINRIPGQVLVFFAVVLIHIKLGLHSWGALLLIAAVTAFSVYAERRINKRITREYGPYKAGNIGTNIGAILMLAYLGVVLYMYRNSLHEEQNPVLSVFWLGMLILPAIFAYLCEWRGRKDAVRTALKPAFAATLAFLCTTFIKVIVLSIMMIWLLLEYIKEFDLVIVDSTSKCKISDLFEEYISFICRL